MFECNILHLTKEQHTTFTQRVKKQTTMSMTQYILTSENISSNGGFSLGNQLMSTPADYCHDPACPVEVRPPDLVPLEMYSYPMLTTHSTTFLTPGQMKWEK